MGFHIPDHVKPIRQRVLSFVEEQVYDYEKDFYLGNEAASKRKGELVALAKKEGLWALGHPKSMGGGGLPWLDYAYVNEVIGRSDAAMDVFGTYSLQTCLMLDRAASDWQREALLRPSVEGDIHVAFSVTEPHSASSDPTNIQTTAVLDGDEWVINGRKWYVSGGGHAAWICVMCLTDPEAASAYERFSMILVPADAAGLTQVRDMHVMGLTHMNHPEFTFQDVRVPADHLLGERGHGFKLFQVRLGPARMTNCMRWIGQAQRAFDFMCDRINTRRLAGNALLSSKQIMQEYVYDSYVDIRSCRMLVFDAAERLGDGEQARVELSAVKSAAARMLSRVLDRAIQVHGAWGVSNDLPLEAMYRMARIMRIVDGPDEVHIERVGRMILRAYEIGEGWDFSTR